MSETVLNLFEPSPPGETQPPDGMAVDAISAATLPRHGGLLPLALQFLKFGTVGAFGFLWDTSTVYALRPFIGFVAATFVAYFIAATMNWILNRLWTFRGRGSQDGLFRQWLNFLGANGLGFVLNRSTVFALAWSIPFCLDYPVTALAAGSLAGMCANFTLSRRLVYR
ncbi:MAG: GtrA family protein [Janthinobacterium lividum]